MENRNANRLQRWGELLRLRMAGTGSDEMFRRFHVSRELMRDIRLCPELAGVRKHISEKMQARIRSANSLRRRWNSVVLIEALFEGTREIGCLAFHFEERSRICLRDLMDMLAPSNLLADMPSFHKIPASRTRCLGIVTYAAIVERLSALDLGEAFNTEWRARRRAFLAYLRKNGSTNCLRLCSLLTRCRTGSATVPIGRTSLVLKRIFLRF